MGCNTSNNNTTEPDSTKTGNKDAKSQNDSVSSILLTI